MAGFAGSLDANAVLRLLLKDIPGQHAAVEKLLLGAANQYAVADIVIIEVVFVLEKHYQFTRLQITEAIEGLMSLLVINCNRALFAEALPVFQGHPSLSLEDCCLATYARFNDAEPLWTFDKKLANQVPSAKLIAAP